MMLERGRRGTQAIEPSSFAGRRKRIDHASLNTTVVSPADTVVDPFETHHLRRYAFAWKHLVSRTGRHLDLGCGVGEFLLPLRDAGALRCVGADPHPKYLSEIRAATDVPLVRVGIADNLPFRSGTFRSITLLDVLEHVPREPAFLAEVNRVMAPGGLLLVTVPARHIFSFLDPDQFKFRHPALHRAVYTARFGTEVYRDRFVDRSDHLFGDMSLGRHEHTNYRRDELARLLCAAGFERLGFEGANLFWRFFQIPALLSRGRLRRVFERAILVDGRLFSGANLFVAAYKPLESAT